MCAPRRRLVGRTAPTRGAASRRVAAPPRRSRRPQPAALSPFSPLPLSHASPLLPLLRSTRLAWRARRGRLQQITQPGAGRGKHQEVGASRAVWGVLTAGQMRVRPHNPGAGLQHALPRSGVGGGVYSGAWGRPWGRAACMRKSGGTDPVTASLGVCVGCIHIGNNNSTGARRAQRARRARVPRGRRSSAPCAPRPPSGAGRAARGGEHAARWGCAYRAR
jgi:hypothetical protein